MSEVEAFKQQMDEDLAEANRMLDAEEKLSEAVLNFEKLFRVKLEVKQCQRQL